MNRGYRNMGAWGAKLYDDDVAEEARDAYKKRLAEGKPGAEATREVLADLSCYVTDDEDGPIFWFALADTQWDMGRLEEQVKQEALRHIEDGSDLERWRRENPKEAKVREAVLESLKQKLSSPQPPEKKIRVKKPYKCEWSTGDVYAYLLENDHSKEMGFGGRYLLFHKIYETTFLGDIVPLVRVKITEGGALPANGAEFEKLEYVRMGRPYLTKDEDQSLKNRMEYLLELASHSKRVIPKKLIFIGNYQNISPPQDEYIHKDLITWRVLWKWLETLVIKRYMILNQGRTDISSGLAD